MIGDNSIDQEMLANCGMDFIFFEDGHNDNVIRDDIQHYFSIFKELKVILKLMELRK